MNEVYAELAASIPRTQFEDMRFKRLIATERGEFNGWYLVPTNIPNAADYVYYIPTPEAQKTSQGFGGATLRFTLDGGEVVSARGPWHSNSDALFSATGLDIRELHLTRVAVLLGEVEVYRDAAPTLGEFGRGEQIARAFAKLLEKEVQLVSASSGGGLMKGVQP